MGKRILSMIFLLGWCFSAWGASTLNFTPRYGLISPEVTLNPESQRWLARHAVLRVGVWSHTLPPYSVEFEKNAFEGLSADYLAIVAKTLNLPVEIKRYKTRLELVDALNNKQVDLIPYYPQAANHETKLALSIPYSLAQSVLISRRQAKFDRELKDSRYRLMYYGDDELRDLLHKRYPNASLAPASPPLWAYTDTALNEDTVFWSNSATQRYLSQRGLQNIIEGHSTPYMNDVDARFATRANNAPLIAAINEILTNIPLRNAVQIAEAWGLDYQSVVKNHPLDLSEAETRWLAQHRDITVNYDPTHLPFTFLDGKQRIAGLSVELLKLISQRTGIRFRYQPMQGLSSMRDALVNQRDSLIVVSDAASQQSDHIRYTRTYIYSPWVVMTRSDSKWRSFDEMAGKRIGIYERSYYRFDLRQRWPAIDFSENAVSIDSLGQLQDKQVDGFIVPYESAQYLLNNHFNDRFRVAFVAPLPMFRMAMAANAADEHLISILNKALSDIPQPTMQSLMERWIKYTPPATSTSWQSYRSYVLRIVAVAGVCLLFFLCRNHLLKSSLAKQRQHEREMSSQLHYIETLLDDVHKAKRAALRSSEAKSTFLSHMSHEIRTPLAALIGLLEIEHLGQSDPQQRQKNIDLAWQSSRSLLSLVGDILDLAKIESGHFSIRLLPMSLSDVVHDTEALFRQVAHNKGLALNVMLDIDQDAVLFDPVALKQILANLVSNAIKFTTHGEVEVALYQAEVSKPEYVLEVCDSGVGLTPEQQKAIFEPFIQVDQGTNRVSGTGLGLNICRRLAVMLGTELHVESEPNVGSVFMLRFTAQPATLTDAEVEPVEEHPQVSLRMLIVDDNATNRLLLAQQLRYAGHHVLVAEGGEEALALWREHEVDRVITDCNMPGMDGFEFTRQLRIEEKLLNRRAVPIYGLTAMAEERVAQLATQAGMDGCLFKPLERTQLLRVVTGNIASSTRNETLLTLENLAANDPQAWCDLVTTAQQQNARDLAQLQQAALAEDFAGARHAAHQLLGSAKLLRAESLQQSCLAAEQAAEQRESVFLQQLIPAVTTAVAELEALFHHALKKNPNNEVKP
ncbi:transporter substrate-binding domain-containing protein [Pantoea sp. S18]|uniref:transporter substrate-binding domain-containing protein n=1 Tax=Pantoea sp. S18 TaxID=3019892 RepID=UPI00132C6E8E|nr:transporter substrate-binding domain-containing protein [Pantoea sp. S18]MEA5104928.1 transporter substrate-binding domain-containing protein [Pantoea sp. S18]MRS19652.1 transporter substrate-binding domain-containing protein [Enterobacteriaceae bacterium RIT692]